MRISRRQLTRLTNGFSKKLENHAATVALYFMHDNFGRVHQMLGVTPAMAIGRQVKEIAGKPNRQALWVIGTSN